MGIESKHESRILWIAGSYSERWTQNSIWRPYYGRKRSPYVQGSLSQNYQSQYHKIDFEAPLKQKKHLSISTPTSTHLYLYPYIYIPISISLYLYLHLYLYPHIYIYIPFKEARHYFRGSLPAPPSPGAGPGAGAPRRGPRAGRTGASKLRAVGRTKRVM